MLPAKLALISDCSTSVHELANMDVFGEVAMDLLSVLGTILAFLGFLCAIYFSREWSTFTKRALKALVLAMGVSSLLIGACSTWLVVESSALTSLTLISIGISHLLVLAIVCMTSGALIVTALTLIRG